MLFIFGMLTYGSAKDGWCLARLLFRAHLRFMILTCDSIWTGTEFTHLQHSWECTNSVSFFFSTLSLSQHRVFARSNFDACVLSCIEVYFEFYTISAHLLYFAGYSLKHSSLASVCIAKGAASSVIWELSSTPTSHAPLHEPSRV
jgi:hypothetical protein